MKKLLLISLIFLCNEFFSQTRDFSKNGVYIWIHSNKLQPSNFAGISNTIVVGTGTAAITTTVSEIPSLTDQKFRVLEVISGTLAVIQIIDYTNNSWDWHLTKSKRPAKKVIPRPEFYKYNFVGSPADYNSLSADEANARDYGNKQKYFTVALSVIEDPKQCKKEEMIGASFAVGALNFPFKYRPENGDFSGAFNFGLALGINIRHKSWRTFTSAFVFGFSFTNVNLDSSNCNKNQEKLATMNNFSAGSMSAGFLVQNGRVQLGAFIGFDRLTSITQRQFEWKYQGKPWLSLGIGIGVFAPQERNITTASDQ